MLRVTLYGGPLDGEQRDVPDDRTVVAFLAPRIRHGGWREIVAADKPDRVVDYDTIEYRQSQGNPSRFEYVYPSSKPVTPPSENGSTS